MKSRSRSESTTPRTSRDTYGQVRPARIEARKNQLLARWANRFASAAAIASIGKISTRSAKRIMSVSVRPPKSPATAPQMLPKVPATRATKSEISSDRWVPCRTWDSRS